MDLLRPAVPAADQGQQRENVHIKACNAIATGTTHKFVRSKKYF